MAIDTQEVVDTLEQAGVPVQQAKAHAAVLADALAAHSKDIQEHCCSKLDLARAVAPLASKQDLAEAKAELHQGLVEAKAEFRQGLSDLKLDSNQRLAEVKAEFHRELKEQGEKLEAKIVASFRGDLIKWGLGMLFAQTGLVALVIQLYDFL